MARKRLLVLITWLEQRVSLKEVVDPMQMEVNRRVCVIRQEKQTIPEKLVISQSIYLSSQRRQLTTAGFLEKWSLTGTASFFHFCETR
jgi:hypothetical protein